jgi:energy-converting hydrogenase Eha subunit B
MLKTSAVDVSYVEVAQFGVGVGSASNYRIDTSSNITEGFFGPAFTDQYNWLTVNKNGSIKFWTGNSGTTERVTIDNIGRVGIGTTTPPHPLSVNGNIRMMSNNSLIYGTATDTSQQASLNLCSNDNKTYLNYGSGGAFNVCDNNGSQRFYVYDNAAGFIQYDTDTSGQIASLNLANSPGATAKSLRFHTNLGVGNYNSITQEGDKGIFFTNGIVDSGNLVIAPWASAPAKGIRMDSAGRVGIGTSNPQALIDIYYGAGSTGSDGSNQIAFQWNSGGYRHFIRSRHDSAIGSSSNALDFFLNNSTSSSASTGPGTGNTLGMSITANGVGVGRTPGSTYALDVSGGDIRVTNNGANSILDLTSVGGTLSIRRSSGTNGNTDILNFGSGSFNIYTNITTSPCMTINSSGNVGIGTEGSVNSAAKVLIGNDLCIARGSSGTADDGGAISFVTYSGRTNEPMSQIKGILINQTGSEQQGGISFSTRPFGTAGQVMTERMRIKSDGSVGIGNTPDSTYKLDVTGKIRATDDIIAFSDERVKKNIYTIENALEKIRNLRGVCYTPIDSSVKKIGVIAQEIEKILPEVVSTDSSPDQYKSVAYGNIVALLIEGIKELAAKVDALEGKI